MGSIKTSIDISSDLTTTTVKGRITSEYLFEWLFENYGKIRTMFVLWDLREAEVPEITTEQIRKMVHLVKNNSHIRAGGKSAMIASQDLEFGFSRMLQSLLEIEDIPIELQIFRTIEEAKEWFGILGESQ